MNSLESIVNDEMARRREFPIAGRWAFFGNAGVAPLPRAVADAVRGYATRSERDGQDVPDNFALIGPCREKTAELLGVQTDEVALLGPTSLGLSLVALGLDWAPGDEAVFYADDYPANVYPWRGLEARGVRPVAMQTEQPGVITWDTVAAHLTERTKLVSLASNHFLSGYRPDIDGIGRELRAREILFCVDGIQTVGAFPTPLEHVDFMSADSHKWMLGPNLAGVLYVRRAMQDRLQPALLGSSNVHAPEYISQEELKLVDGAARYEPGSPNLAGIAGMLAAVELLLGFGRDNISARILELRQTLLDALRPKGWRLMLEDWDTSSEASDAHRSGIISLWHPGRDMSDDFFMLREQGVRVSLRKDRAGTAYLRFSPHAYNTAEELHRAASLLG